MSALTALQSATSSSQNLATGVTVQSYAASAGLLIRPVVRLASLNAAAATFTIIVRNTTDTKDVYRFSEAKSVAAHTGADFTLPPFISEAKTYAIVVSSSNASDTAASVTVSWYDESQVETIAIASGAVTAAAIAADAITAAKLATDAGTEIGTAVWATTTRLLTAGTNIVLAKGVGITGFNDIAATAIVSSGAITTSGGAVTTVTSVTNAVTANVTEWGGTAVASALVRANVIQWTGTNVATPTVAGVPEVDITHVGGTAASPITTTSAPDNWSEMQISVDGIVHADARFIEGVSATGAIADQIEAGIEATTPLNSAGTDTLITRITALRAGYMDNLNSGGVLPTAAAVASIKTDTGTTIPAAIEEIEGGGGGGTTRSITIENRNVRVTTN